MAELPRPPDFERWPPGFGASLQRAPREAATDQDNEGVWRLSPPCPKVAPFLQAGGGMVRATALGTGILLCAAAFGCEAYLVDGGLGGLAGGGSTAGAPSDGAVEDTCASFYAEFEPTGDVSFRDDLVPILREKCNSSICHGGEPDAAQASLWLGPDDERDLADEDLWFVYRSLIDIQSTVAPRLALVRRGNAAESYFMRKLDDCHDPVGLACSLDPDLYGSACGEAMPVLAGKLSETERSLFRSWIQNGAPEN